MSDKKLSILAIVVQDRAETAPKVNALLSHYGDVIVARMGIPHNERNLNLISVIVEAPETEIAEIIKKLTEIANVQVKTLTV